MSEKSFGSKTNFVVKNFDKSNEDTCIKVENFLELHLHWRSRVGPAAEAAAQGGGRAGGGGGGGGGGQGGGGRAWCWSPNQRQRAIRRKEAGLAAP